jgi:hypothetical protein
MVLNVRANASIRSHRDLEQVHHIRNELERRGGTLRGGSSSSAWRTTLRDHSNAKKSAGGDSGSGLALQYLTDDNAFSLHFHSWESA